MTTESPSGVAAGVGCGDVTELLGASVAIGLDATDELVAVPEEGSGEASCRRFVRPQEISNKVARRMSGE
jgi:hypothetical protein